MEKVESGDNTCRRLSIEQRLERFADATRRQAIRNSEHRSGESVAGRGWTREDLYERGGVR
jgi:hypothetical protein